MHHVPMVHAVRWITAEHIYITNICNSQCECQQSVPETHSLKCGGMTRGLPAAIIVHSTMESISWLYECQQQHWFVNCCDCRVFCVVLLMCICCVVCVMSLEIIEVICYAQLITSVFIIMEYCKNPLICWKLHMQNYFGAFLFRGVC